MAGLTGFTIQALTSSKLVVFNVSVLKPGRNKLHPLMVTATPYRRSTNQKIPHISTLRTQCTNTSAHAHVPSLDLPLSQINIPKQCKEQHHLQQNAHPIDHTIHTWNQEEETHIESLLTCTMYQVSTHMLLPETSQVKSVLRGLTH